MVDLGVHQLSGFSENDFTGMLNVQDINSIRLYQAEPDYSNLAANVQAVIYPKKTYVLDSVDLAPKVKHWVEATSQTMGNWTSRETFLRNLELIDGEAVPSYEKFPLAEMNEMLLESAKIVAVGFDVLQSPRCKITFNNS